MLSYNTEQLIKLESFILKAIAEVSELVEYEETHHIGGENHFGDQQLKIDVLSDEIIFSNLRESQLVKYALSEEKPELHDMSGMQFIVTFDPLDGSSIIDVNWTVGTIYAIWPNENKLLGQTPSQIVSSGIAMYGPRTTVVKYNVEKERVEELTLKTNEVGKKEWCRTKDQLKIAPKTKIFAPANLRATSDNKQYEELFEYWRSNEYTLRYSGGLVPDIYQIFLRGNGVFSNPASEAAPAKLRFLYEVAPISFLVEKAGGKSTDGTRSIMDIEVVSYVMRNTLCVGSEEEVQRFVRMLGTDEKKALMASPVKELEKSPTTKASMASPVKKRGSSAKKTPKVR